MFERGKGAYSLTMTYPLHVQRALARLELESLEGLTTSYVEELVNRSEEVQRQPLLEFEYWEAFHLLREVTNKSLDEQLESARKSARVINKFESNAPVQRQKSEDVSRVIPFERREIRKNLGNLIYEIRELNLLQPKLIQATKIYEKCYREVKVLMEMEETIAKQSVQITANILELEKKIASIHNDKTLNLDPSQKQKKQDLLRNEIRDLKEARRNSQPTTNPKLNKSQTDFFVSENQLRNVEDRISSLTEKLNSFRQEVQIFSVVHCFFGEQEKEFFVGPFLHCRNPQGFEYISSTSQDGQTLLGKRVGDEVEVNRKTLFIKEIRLPDPKWLEGLMHPNYWEADFVLDLPEPKKRIELWSRSPNFSNNSRHTKGG